MLIHDLGSKSLKKSRGVVFTKKSLGHRPPLLLSLVLSPKGEKNNININKYQVEWGKHTF